MLEYLIQNVVLYLAATSSLVSNYFPCRNFFIKKEYTIALRYSDPIHSASLLLEEEELTEIASFRKNLRKTTKKGVKNKAYSQFYLKHKSEILDFLRGLKLNKVKVFIEFGLPKRDGLIQVPLTHRSTHETQLGEVRVLDGFHIDWNLSACELREQLEKRSKKAKENLNRTRNETLSSGVCLQLGQEGKKSDLCQEALPQQDGQVEVGMLLPFGIGPIRKPIAVSLNTQISSSAFSDETICLENREGNSLAGNLQNDTQEQIAGGFEKENADSKTSSFGSCSQGFFFKKYDKVGKAGGGQLERQRFNNLTFELGESAQKMMAKKLSQIAVLEKFRAMTEEEGKKALDLAQSARKKTELFTQKIQGLRELINCIKTKTN